MVARRLFALAACAFALTAAGCGSAAGVDARDYRVDAERICAQGNDDAYDLQKRQKKLQEEPDRDRFFAESADITRDAVKTARPYLDRLAALERPAADDDKIEAWLADQKRRLALLQQLGDAYAAEDEARVSVLAEQLDDLQQRLTRFAKGYGLAVCAAAV